MQRAAAERTYARIHEAQPYHDGTFHNWSEHPSDLTPFHASDGVEIYVAETDVNPDDAFLVAPDITFPGESADEPPINDVT